MPPRPARSTASSSTNPSASTWAAAGNPNLPASRAGALCPTPACCWPARPKSPSTPAAPAPTPHCGKTWTLSAANWPSAAWAWWPRWGRLTGSERHCRKSPCGFGTGKPKAVTAASHKLARLTYAMLIEGAGTPTFLSGVTWVRRARAALPFGFANQDPSPATSG